MTKLFNMFIFESDSHMMKRIAYLIYFFPFLLTAQVDTIWLKHDGANAAATYEIQAGETLYQLQRKLNVPVTDIIMANSELDVSDIEIGTQIKIPFKPIRKSIKTTRLPQAQTVFCYRVKPKENLFRISRIYFDIPTSDMISMNQLNGLQLSINQILTIGYLDQNFTSITNQTIEENPAPNDLKVISGVTDSTLSAPVITTDSMFTPSYISIDSTAIDSLVNTDSIMVMRTPFDAYAEEGYSIFHDRGVAFWDKRAEETTRLFVLHTKAKINSLMEITNPMNRQKVYAKVIGHIPPGAYTSDIKVVVSPGVAKKLGALDGRFYIHYQYIQ